MLVTLMDIPGLSIKNREIVILATCAKFEAAYALYTHKVLGPLYGITQEELDTILRGERPKTLDDQARACYDVAYELTHRTGPLSEETWSNAVKQLSKSGATAVVQYVAWYSYVSTIVNGFDTKVPGPGRPGPML
jgi:hypothetical protein